MSDNEEQCFICKRYSITEEHHCLSGTSNRSLSEKYGLKVHLCPICHRIVHDNKESREYELFLKREAQKKFEEVYGNRKDFIRIFGKSWL